MVSKNRDQEGIRVLARLHSRGDIESPLVQAEYAEIHSKLEWERQNEAPGYIDMLFGRERRRTWLGIGVQFMQQVTGVNVSHLRFAAILYPTDAYQVIMYYAVFLFQQAGISGTQSSLLANGIQGVVLNVFVWPDMFWMDTWGRRTPMVIGGFGMGVAMMLIGVLMRTEGMSQAPKSVRVLMC